MNAESVRSLSDDDLRATLKYAENIGMRIWNRAVLASGEHPENVGTVVRFDAANPYVDDLAEVNSDITQLVQEMDRRGLVPTVS